MLAAYLINSFINMMKNTNLQHIIGSKHKLKGLTVNLILTFYNNSIIIRNKKKILFDMSRKILSLLIIKYKIKNSAKFIYLMQK